MAFEPGMFRFRYQSQPLYRQSIRHACPVGRSGELSRSMPPKTAFLFIHNTIFTAGYATVLPSPRQKAHPSHKRKVIINNSRSRADEEWLHWLSSIVAISYQTSLTFQSKLHLATSISRYSPFHLSKQI